MVPQTELVDQYDMRGTFPLSQDVLFKFRCIIFMLIIESCVNVLGLKVKSLGKSLHVSSPLGIRVRIDQICRDCELEILGILLTVDLRVMDISDFDVILRMDWLTTH